MNYAAIHTGAAILQASLNQRVVSRQVLSDTPEALYLWRVTNTDCGDDSIKNSGSDSIQ